MAEGENNINNVNCNETNGNANEINFDITEIDFYSITQGGMFFGNREFNCPRKNPNGIKEVMGYYLKNKALMPPYCDNCYRACLFWKNPIRNSDEYNQENLRRLEKLVKAFRGFEYTGKVSDVGTFFYFNQKQDAVDFLEFLKEQTQRFGIRGVLDWQKACDIYWKLLPKLWPTKKEFLGESH